MNGATPAASRGQSAGKGANSVSGAAAPPSPTKSAAKHPPPLTSQGSQGGPSLAAWVAAKVQLAQASSAAAPASADPAEAQKTELQAKIDKKTEEVEKAEREYKAAKKGRGGEAEKKKAAVKRLLEQLNRLETQKTDKEENKQIALGTSKLNYLDPRISVAWCKKFEVPLEKVYNKTQREKFRWAIDMTDENYEF